MSVPDNFSSFSFNYNLPPQTKEGHKVNFFADEKQKKMISQLLEIEDISKLTASFNINRKNPFEAKLSGNIHAKITQLCVLSLEPIYTTLNFSFIRQFVKELTLPISDKEEEWENIETDQDIWDGKNIDLATIIIEELMININPYPRKKGRRAINIKSVETSRDVNEAEKINPFMVLEQLKTKK